MSELTDQVNYVAKQFDELSNELEKLNLPVVFTQWKLFRQYVGDCNIKISSLESQLSQVQGENADLKEHNEEMRKAIRDVNDKLTERDALKAENEKLTALINKEHHFKLSLLDKQLSLQKEVQRYKMALEYIELTGGNVGHVAITGVPHDCCCGGCMASEASKALASQGE